MCLVKMASNKISNSESNGKILAAGGRYDYCSLAQNGRQTGRVKNTAKFSI